MGKKQRREEKRDRKRKRRETAVVDLTEDGGFLDDGGGFVDDDVGEGGFIDGGDIAGGGFVDDDNAGGFVEEDDMGAFVADEDTTNDPTPAGPSASMSRRDSPSAAQRIPLYILPGILTSLGLPADDDVLAVFRASASGWADGEEEETPGGRRPQVGDGEQESGGVELKDFRAVCAALMGPDEGNEDGDEDLEKRSDQAFEMESSSSLSSLPDSGDDYGQASETSRGKGKGKAVAGASLRRGKKKVDPDLEEMAQIRLSAGQKEMVKSLWEMVKPNATGRGANILGREEVKGFARGLSEMWSEEEVGLTTRGSCADQG